MQHLTEQWAKVAGNRSDRPDCSGVGKEPSDEATDRAARRVYDETMRSRGKWDLPEGVSGLYGRKGCPDCDGVYQPTTKGGMPKHKPLVKR